MTGRLFPGKVLGRRVEAPHGEDARRDEWTSQAVLDGWKNYEYNRPPCGVLVQIWRYEWESPSVVVSGFLHPEMNVNGLYWRLTGIGRMYLDSLPYEVSSQMEATNGFGNAYGLGAYGFMGGLRGRE